MSDARTRTVTVLLKQGLTHYCGGDTPAAITCWEEALELDPENRAVHDYLEVAYEEMGETMAAAELRNAEPGQPVHAIPLGRSQAAPAGEAPAPAEPAPSAPKRPAAAKKKPAPAQTDLTELLERAEAPRGGGAAAAAPTVCPPAASGLDAQVAEGLAAFKAGEFDQAWRILAEVSKTEPERLDVQGYLQLIRKEQAQAWVREIGDQGRLVSLRISTPELMKRKLAPDEGFLIGLVDGNVTIADLISLSCADRVRTLQILARFLREEIIG